MYMIYSALGSGNNLWLIDQSWVISYQIKFGLLSV